MNSLAQVPEIAALASPPSLIRLPEQIDVPVTQRITRLIDTPAFQRLKSVSQLGFVSWIYPGATHSRFEHSLGVYRLALLFIRRLSNDERFNALVTPKDVELLLVSALLHDIAHWPFCHPIEDICLPEVPQHESLAIEKLKTPELSRALQEDWDIQPEQVQMLLTKKVSSNNHRILSSILSGPIDVDKMDYLYRDSLHSGVPYGRNFDTQRLIASLCLNESGDRLAITDKGKTAAELMVFARYVMFSEVYWHHAVRSATAMFQRAFFMIREDLEQANLGTLFNCRENEIVGVMNVLDRERVAAPLLEGLFGSTRSLYKRWAQFNFAENQELYSQIAGKPYPEIFQLSQRVVQAVSNAAGIEIQPHEILLDAPPLGLEVQFDVDVFSPRENSFTKLGVVSPVVKTLASRQFDNFVKRIRLFVHPRIASVTNSLKAMDILADCLR
jgi:HD superfamily phosphohydrolase